MARHPLTWSLLLCLWICAEANACGPETDCVLGDRTYRVALSSAYADTRSRGAVIFVHGYRGKSAGVMRNTSLTALASELGAVFVAVQAAGDDWNLPGSPSKNRLQGVDELAYFDALSQDLSRRFGVDPRRTLVTGFSSGGMMVWHLACHRGDAYAGFAPIAGTFWEPVPRDCPTGAVNLVHYHGTDDKVVPLRGRRIKDSHQGDVYRAFEMLRRVGGYGPEEMAQLAELECTRQRNDKGKRLELCLFAGGHELKAQHIERAWHDFGLSLPPE